MPFGKTPGAAERKRPRDIEPAPSDRSFPHERGKPGGGVLEAIGGTPLEIVSFFADTPRGLAKKADGSTVYVCGFNTGNQTTIVNEGTVCDGFQSSGGCSGDGISMPGGLPGGQMPGGEPGPSANIDGVAAPEVGLIVKYDRQSGIWTDELSRNWNNAVRFNLPDEDCFALDAATLNQTAVHAHIGTTLFNACLLYTSPSPRDVEESRMPSSA